MKELAQAAALGAAIGVVWGMIYIYSCGGPLC